MSKATALTPLDPDEVEQCVRNIADGTQPAAGRSLRILRDAAGMSMAQLASLFHRKAPTICSWEQGQKWPRTPELLPGILNSLGIPQSVIAKAFTVEIDGDLDSRLYMRGDPTMIEYGFFMKTRGKVLQRLEVEAERGSVEHAKLYKAWMRENEQGVGSRESKQVRAVESATSSDWTKRALPGAKTTDRETTTCSKSDVKSGDIIDPYSQHVEDKENG